MAADMKWRDAIDKVLGDATTPLHYKDIAERIMSQEMRRNMGATPAATVNAIVTSSIKTEGDSSPYVRVSRGTFAMKSRGTMRAEERHAPAVDMSELEDEEAQYEIVSSFGMFWRRDAVEWNSSPKLLGMQQIGATPVDFLKQLGIYLLYDGREVIYVGRTTDRPLGRRLYEHTLDRMSARWDRFSWFGLLPVSETGELGALPGTVDGAKLIPALEAILIEALEPRQNRKRGDDLAAVEYIQAVDPEIEKRRVKATLDTVLKRM